MKRKAEDQTGSTKKDKKRAVTGGNVESQFSTTLFDAARLEKYKSDYAISKP